MLVAVPDGPVTVIVPVVVPIATTAVIFVSELTVKVCAFVPLNSTAVVPVKPEPVIVTVFPAVPLVGENEVIASIV